MWAELSEVYPWDDERGLLVAYLDVLRFGEGLWPDRVGVVTIIDAGDTFEWSAYRQDGACTGIGVAATPFDGGRLGFVSLGGEA